MSTKIGKFDDLTPEQNEKLDNLLLSDQELKELDRSTRPDVENDDYENTDRDYSEEELKQLYDDFADYENGDVRYEHGGEPPFHKDKDGNDIENDFSEVYKQTGLHKISYDNPAKDRKWDKCQMSTGELLIQYHFPGRSGSYFAPPGTDLKDMQLPDSGERRIISIYEVIAPLKDNPQISAFTSIVGDQYYNQKNLTNIKEASQVVFLPKKLADEFYKAKTREFEKDFDKNFREDYQMRADELVELGILRKKNKFSL